jgi:hypothetical protein
MNKVYKIKKEVYLIKYKYITSYIFYSTYKSYTSLSIDYKINTISPTKYKIKLKCRRMKESIEISKRTID